MAESKEQHSPTPWFVDGTTVYFRVRKDGYDSEPAVAECGPDVDSTAWVDKESDDPKLTRLANAEFIVRAVNSHEALVDAARKAVNLMSYLHWESDPHGRKDKAEVYNELATALALAEKES